MYEIEVRYKSATVTLVVWEDEATISLSSLYVEHRRRGHASGVMERVCVIADSLGQNLVLRVAPYSDHPRMDQRQLKTFYKKFDFQENSYDIMSRAPQNQEIQL